MHIRTALVALLLLATGHARAEMPDLKGAVFVQNGCRLPGVSGFYCTVYEKSGALFFFLRDEEDDVVKIYRVRNWARPPFRPSEPELLWDDELEEVMLV